MRRLAYRRNALERLRGLANPGDRAGTVDPSAASPARNPSGASPEPATTGNAARNAAQAQAQAQAFPNLTRRCSPTTARQEKTMIMETAFEVLPESPEVPATANKPLPVDAVLALRRSVAAGETIAAAARRLGRSENAVRRAVRGRRGNLGGSHKDVPEASAGGVDPVAPRASAGRPPRIGEDVVRAVRAARARGEALTAVASRFGISRGHASRICRGDARLDVEGDGAGACA